MNKLILILCFTSFLNACTNVTESTDDKALILLNAIHPVTSGLNESKQTQTQLLDNDGNLYITYWDVPNEGRERFKGMTESCKKSIRKDRIFLNAFSIHDFNIGDIRPSLFVPYVKCLSNYGYTLIDKEGYSPDSYELAFFHSHATTSEYMPVGANYSIRKKGSRYISVYNDVIACEKSLLAQGGGVIESRTGYTISVSIEKYVADFEACMVKKSYAVKKIDSIGEEEKD